MDQTAERRLPQAGTFTSFAEIFDRTVEELQPRPPAADEAAATLAAVQAAAAPVVASQGGYQPLYGVDAAGSVRREETLRHSVEFLKKEFAGASRNKGQIRLLDVGCNAGFVSFALAETFPNTVGFDINANNIALCHALKRHSGSPALFFKADLLEVAERADAGLESLDAILFLNVIHQLIFAKGIPYVKALLGRLSRSVDLMVVELAQRAEYVRHGKAELLPLDPAEILEECRDATITQIRNTPRPVYVLRRRALAVEGLSVPFSRIAFSSHADGRVSRKYHYGSDTFTKTFRYSSLQSQAKFAAERDGLAAVAGLAVGPRLLASTEGPGFGRVVMQRLYGPALTAALPGLVPAERVAALREVIRIGAALAGLGLAQNDFSGHNFHLVSDGSLRMIDYEQVGTALHRDPFAMLLWVANDLAAGATESYKRRMSPRLNLPRAEGGAFAPRVESGAYPDPGPAAAAFFGPELAAILEEARHTEAPWLAFIHSAWQRITPP